MGAGGVMGVLRFIQTRIVGRGIGMAVKTFCVVGVVNVEYARQQREKEITAIKATVDMLNRKEAAQREQQRAAQPAAGATGR